MHRPTQFSGRWAGRAVCILALLGLAACGSSSAGPRPAPSAGGERTGPAAANPGGLALPDPQSLLAEHQLAALPAGWTRDGAQFEALLPHNLIGADGADGLYAPAYISSAQSSLADVAYGIYQFTPGSVSVDTTVHLAWDVPGAQSATAWVAAANFSQNRWDWFFPGSADQVLLSSFAPYRRPGDQLMLVAVALTGEQPARLNKLWLTTELPADTIYAIPAETEAEKGDTVRVTVYVNETAEPLFGITARVLVTEGVQLVPDSFNMGIPGGATDYPDGVWAKTGTTNFFCAVAEAIWEVPADKTGFDFAIVSVGGMDIPSATGALFNFEVLVNQSTELLFQRETEWTKRTYYSNLQSTDDISWTNDTNEGQPAIHVRGTPTAMLTAEPLDGDTPLEVSFDASQSIDEPPGSIIRYEFDFGEGDGYENNGLNPQSRHVYQWHGGRTAKVKVTDDRGLIDIASLSVSPKRYDEVEDNDSIEQAGSLPGDQFFGFRGNVGDEAQFPAYDGDTHDYYALNLEAGVYYRVMAVIDEPESYWFVMALNDHSGEQIRWSDYIWGLNSYLEYLPQAEDLPLTLTVFGDNRTFDYELAVMRWPPVASLKSDRYSGELPLALTLNAAFSSDTQGDGIVRYEFCFEEGGEFIDNGSNPIAGHVYSSEDLYLPRVRVYDDDGNFDVKVIEVYAGQEFDEIEPNNFRDVLQKLNMTSGISVRGSCGYKAGVYQGYNGSGNDYWYFSASAGDTVSLTLEHNSATGNLDLYLMDSYRTELAASESESDLEELSYVIKAEDGAKFYVLVTNNGHGGQYSDYILTGNIAGP